jgi:hypothetical protein
VIIRSTPKSPDLYAGGGLPPFIRAGSVFSQLTNPDSRWAKVQGHVEGVSYKRGFVVAPQGNASAALGTLARLPDVVVLTRSKNHLVRLAELDEHLKRGKSVQDFKVAPARISLDVRVANGEEVRPKRVSRGTLQLLMQAECFWRGAPEVNPRVREINANWVGRTDIITLEMSLEMRAETEEERALAREDYGAEIFRISSSVVIGPSSNQEIHTLARAVNRNEAWAQAAAGAKFLESLAIRTFNRESWGSDVKQRMASAMYRAVFAERDRIVRAFADQPERLDKATRIMVKNDPALLMDIADRVVRTGRKWDRSVWA